ncbi:MAG: PEP-CTERM sorting domain-containing protein [Massilia sp.]
MIRRFDTSATATGTHKRQAILSLSALGLACVLAAFLLKPSTPLAPRHPSTALASPALQPLVAPAVTDVAKGRRIYPFSVVPGGVASREELARVVNRDPVVAEHYAGFNVDIARIVTLAKPRAVYVSYRKGDKIFWTARKITLPQGETLLSDGVNEVRTRCGNRVSDVPQLPVAADEPSLEVLDSSVVSDGGLQLTAAEVDLGEGDFAGPSHQLQTFGQADQLLGNANAGTRAGFGTPGIGTPSLGTSTFVINAPRAALMAPALIGTAGDTPGGAAGGASSSSSGAAGGNTAGGAGGIGAAGDTVAGNGGPRDPADGAAPGFVGTEQTANLIGPGQIKPDPSDIEAPDTGPGSLLTELTGQARTAASGEVPEPATPILMLAAFAGLALIRRRRVAKV